MIALRMSFCRGNIDAPGKRLHPSLQGRWGTSRPLPCANLPPRRRSRRSRGCLLGATQQRGTSVTYTAEQLAAEVIRSHILPTPLVWIEHWPEETTEGQVRFALVDFSGNEVVERAPYLGETRAWIGDATWKQLDSPTVEALVGGKV